VTNFTAYCDKHEPEDVVSRLDALFVIFERITTKHGLDKIKTIGDGFMAVAGLLHKLNDPIGSAVRCGLEMNSTLIDAQLNWEVRMGVHDISRHRRDGRPLTAPKRTGKAVRERVYEFTP
jgi:adenylate cyclase